MFLCMKHNCCIWILVYCFNVTANLLPIQFIYLAPIISFDLTDGEEPAEPDYPVFILLLIKTEISCQLCGDVWSVLTKHYKHYKRTEMMGRRALFSQSCGVNTVDLNTFSKYLMEACSGPAARCKGSNFSAVTGSLVPSSWPAGRIRRKDVQASAARYCNVLSLHFVFAQLGSLQLYSPLDHHGLT